MTKPTSGELREAFKAHIAMIIADNAHGLPKIWRDAFRARAPHTAELVLSAIDDEYAPPTGAEREGVLEEVEGRIAVYHVRAPEASEEYASGWYDAAGICLETVRALKPSPPRETLLAAPTET